MSERKRVTGIGGIFFKNTDAQAQNEWYAKHLGIKTGPWGTTFEWRDKDNPETIGQTVWSAFKADSKHFEPSAKEFIINYIVEDLDWLVENLRAEGVQVLGDVQDSEYGKFAHILDPEGNKIELWQPPKDAN